MRCLLRQLAISFLVIPVLLIGHESSHAEPLNQAQPHLSAASGNTNHRQSDIGTKTSPLVVQSFETNEDVLDKELAKDQRRIEIRNNNFSTALAAGVLLVAVAQVGLFVWQLAYMKQSLVDTGLAAEAAMKSADIATQTLYTTQSAFVTVPKVRTEFEWPEPLKPPRAFLFRFEVANKGMTPARNLLMFLDHRLVPYEQRDNQAFEWVEPKRPTPVFLTPEVSITSEYVLLPFHEMVEVMERRKAFILFGELRYEDVFGRQHKTQSCWELVVQSDIRELRQDRPMPGGWRWLVYWRHNYSE